MGIAIGAIRAPIAVTDSLQGLLILDVHCRGLVIALCRLHVPLSLLVKALQILLQVPLHRPKQLVLSNYSADLFEDKIQLLRIQILEVQRLDILADTLLQERLLLVMRWVMGLQYLVKLVTVELKLVGLADYGGLQLLLRRDGRVIDFDKFIHETQVLLIL